MISIDENNVAEELPENVTLIYESKFARVATLDSGQVIICQATDMFIPTEYFTSLYKEIGEYIKSGKVSKLIFDKRSLKIFDQKAMTWYHIVWKKEMLTYGLKTWRKLLPQDATFRMSVGIGKDKIKNNHPDFDFNLFDIKYVESFKEALES